MEDKEIVRLYWDRNERAIKETSVKYGGCISLNKWHSRTRKKRGGGQVGLALEELEECIAAGDDVEKRVEQKELLRLINTFLGTLPETERDLFVCRYCFFASIQELCEKFSFSESKTKSMLYRTREKLKSCLEKEGYLS